MLKVYLAGAIRAGRFEDIAWRSRVIIALGGEPVEVLSPLAGKSYDEETKQWRVHGTIAPSAKYIVKHDLWMVNRADVVVVNLTALAEGYPSIGTLVELGAAAALGKLIYVVVDAEYTGHQNQAMYRLHPFIEQVASEVFTSVEALIAYLRPQVSVLLGDTPMFVGTEVER